MTFYIWNNKILEWRDDTSSRGFTLKRAAASSYTMEQAVALCTEANIGPEAASEPVLTMVPTYEN